MSGFVYPALNPDAWNGLTIQGEQVPGYVEFPGFEVTRKVDDKPSPGQDTFALTDKGAVCTEVTIVFLLTLEEHFRDFEGIYKLYLDPRRKLEKRNVVSIVHPSLYLAGIRQGYFHSAGALRPTGEGRSFYKLSSKFKEFNEKTTLGGGGSKKPKPAPSYAGKGGKWTKDALDKNGKSLGKIVGGAGDNDWGDRVPQADQQKATARTPQQLRRSAAAGEPDAKFTTGILDRKAGR